MDYDDGNGIIYVMVLTAWWQWHSICNGMDYDDNGMIYIIGMDYDDEW